MNANNKVVNAYAKSLFQNLTSLSPSGSKKSFPVSQITSSKDTTFLPDVFIVGEELLLTRAILISSEKLQSFFKNPTYAEQQKVEVILNIFPGLTGTMKSFLKILTERSHLSLLPEISEEYNRILLKFKNVTKVNITAATPLDGSFGPMLFNALKNLTGSEEIILSVSYNPKLLGGLILEYNSVAIDASILKEFSLFFNEI